MTQLTLPLPLSSHAEGRAVRAARSEPALRHYQIGPVRVTISSGVPGVIRSYHDLYRRYEVPTGRTDGYLIEVTPRRSRRTGLRHYHIVANGEEAFTVRRRTRILPHVEAAVNLLIARYLPGYLQIHASVMSRDGLAAVFPGRPTVGKTTLAAALLARGWKYLSDEFALIDPVTRRVVPYPKALSVKSGSFDMLARLGLPIFESPMHRRRLKGWVRPLDPYRVRPDAVGRPCRVGLIIFPEHGAGDAPAIEPLSRAEAVFELAHSCFNFFKFRRRGVELLVDVARRASCHRLRTGDLVRSCERVEACLAESLRGEASR